MSNIVDFKLSD